MSGTKFDSDKPDWSFLDLESMNEVLKVLADGAKVHGRDNWKRVKDGKRRYANAAIRHAMKILSGEDRDPEHGTLHAAHVAVNGLFLTFFAFRSERQKKRQKAASREKAFEKQELSRLERGIAIKHDPSPLAESLLRDLAARENLSASSEASSTGAFRELTLSMAREESRS